MTPFFAVLRVVNVLPQVQVTVVSTYAGWMSGFNCSPRWVAPGRPCDGSGREPDRRTSVPASWPDTQTRWLPSAFPTRPSGREARAAYPSRMGDDRATVDYFDHHVHDYSPARLQSAVTFIAEHVTPDSALIDIGCGTGNVLAHISRTTGISQLAGLDVSERCVELTKEKVAADVYRASVLDDATVARFRGGFDVAVMAAVLHHLVGPSRRHSRRAANRAVSNALQMVKPGGYLIVVEPTFTPAVTVFVLFWIKTVLSKIFRRRLPIGGYWNNVGAPVVSYYSTDEVLEMLGGAPDVQIIQVDKAPQRLSKLADLLVSKSNTTVVARRRTTD